MQVGIFTVLLLSVLNKVNTSPTGSATDDKLILLFDCSLYPIDNSLELWREVFVNKSIKEKTVFPDNKTAEEVAKIRVFQKLKQLSDSPESWNATAEEARYVKFYLRDEMREGFNLTNNKKEQLNKALAEIGKKNGEFLKNLQKPSEPLLLNATSLRGVSQPFLQYLTKNPAGYYKVYPGQLYSEISTYCHVEETRRLVYTAWANRGQSGNNSRLLTKLTQLRRKVARLLKYPSYVDYMTEVLMAKNSTNVKNFLEDLAAKLSPKLMRENEEYLSVKRQKCEENNDICSQELQMWDYLYVTDCIKKQNYSVDSQIIREYFPLEAVQEKMFKIFEALLGLRIMKIGSLPDDITRYRVNDSTTGEMMGLFNLDLFDRVGKSLQPKVDAFDFSCSRPDGSRQLPEVVLLMSLPKATKTMPTLLNYRDMKILFHEFGHVLHNMCSRTQLSAFSGTQVERDFAEAPSQMLENWLLEPNVLKNISSHYQNKTQLTDDIVRSIVDSETFDLGYKTMRQLTFAMFDFNLHVNETTDVDQLFRDITKQFMNVTIPSDVRFPGMFGHLAGGYAATYYSYLWSEVFGADMYVSRFKSAGIFNSTVGHEYRDKILAKGGTKDATDLLKDFLGREPNIDAFLQVKHLQ